MSAPWTAMCSVGEEKEKAAKLTVDALEKIEGELKGKRFFGGESIGYSDIALGWMSYWLPIWEEVGSLEIVDPLQFPALTSWMRNFLEHPVIKENLPPRHKMIIYFQNQRQELTSRPRG
ncbi:GLUTATHIONE S-TRANSFERASE GST SUPERFAMILY GST DOMAIN CONTAINING [Salix purpurea]|uniref:Glutathione S-transferase n=1 Tax=Salix purpurea TaxID=77065 RepID=A0A9Q0Z972_SALPP|nr:GLUTATHIONE S-TRANSFERASE GST SUPERFAMILY GST DOMAIN CONTAINING [Salix purpurea]